MTINVKQEAVDNYGQIIPPNILFLKGNFLERVCYNRSSQVFKLSKKETYFYNDSVVYPYVQFTESKKG